jgi:ankyrin repeat protein
MDWAAGGIIVKEDMFFVPVLEKGKDGASVCSLYHVHTINGGSGGIGGVKAFDDDLTVCFKNLRMEELPIVSVSILRFPDKKLLNNLTENTRSVFLGLFIQIYRQHLHLKYQDNWDSITVTGDLAPLNGRTDLKAVKDIAGKYQGVLDYADQHSDKEKHLFLYVTDSGEPFNLKPRSNIEIKVFSPEDSLFALLYFIFGPVPLEIDENRLNERQKVLVKNISGFQYIRPEGFYDMEERVCGRFYRGCFIYGEGDTGKSSCAMALSVLLLNKGMIYAPLWIRVDGKLYDRRSSSPSQDADNHDDYLEDYDDSEEQYLKEKIRTELTNAAGVSVNTPENKRYAIVLDNLEFVPDKIKKLLNALKNVMASLFRLAPYIIVTSRSACDENSFEDFGIKLQKAPELSQDSLSAYIDSLVDGREYKDKIERGRQSAEYYSLLEELYVNYRWYPGVIKTLISLLRYEEIGDLLVAAKQLGTGRNTIQDRQKEMFYKAFTYLERAAQCLLFTLMGMGDPGGSHERDEIFSRMFDLFNNPKNGETRERFITALGNLLDSNFIYREQDHSSYGIKTLPYLLFMFNEHFNGIEMASGESVREYVLEPWWKFYIALEYDQPCAVVKKLLDRYSKEDLMLDNDDFMLAAEKSSSPEKLDLLLEHGCDINYVDEYRLTPFISAVTANPNVSVIEWFFEHNVDTSYKYLGNNAFHFAAAHTPNPKILECMLKHGFKTTDRANDGMLPIGMAARWNGNTAILDFFASRGGFDIDIEMHVCVNIRKAVKLMEGYTDEENEEEENGTYALRTLKLASKFAGTVDNLYITPVHYAVLNSNVEILRWFLEHHAHVEKLADGSTLLNVIAKVQSNPAFLDLLKEYGYDIMEKGEGGLNALHFAALTNSSIPVFEWLINNGIDINTGDDEGGTPFGYALMYNPDPDILDWFIDNGAIPDGNDDTSTINDYFELSLINNDSLAVFQWFLDQDAYINAADSDGDTILHVVAQSDCPTGNIIWMLDHDADPNLCNNEGISALDYLRKRKDWSKINKHIERSKR